MSARVLFLDIETAPSLGWVWQKWQTDVIDFAQHWYLLSFAWKWLGDKDVSCRALPDYSGYKRNHNNDLHLVRDLHDLLDRADIIVAQNGDSFDIKKANARIIFHRLPPPSTYKTVDTLKLARKYFKFESNRLGDLGKFLGVGSKLPHTGFQLWAGCMEGDEDSWRLMREYNKADVALLEEVYYKLRPWAVNHPNLGLYANPSDPQRACPTCQSDRIQKRGFNYAKLQVRQRWQCLDCKSWFSGKVIKKAELDGC